MMDSKHCQHSIDWSSPCQQCGRGMFGNHESQNNFADDATHTVRASLTDAQAEVKRLRELLKKLDGVLVRHHDARYAAWNTPSCPVCPYGLFEQIADALAAE